MFTIKNRETQFTLKLGENKYSTKASTVLQNDQLSNWLPTYL